MNSRISIIAVLLAVLTLMTSCLSNDDSDSTTYDDVAITSFALGTLKRTMHTTTSSGSDSTYVTTASCSSYAFSIDQKKGLIYNVDSLPSGVQTEKSLVTIGTLNSGYVYLKSYTSDSLTVYSSSSDSLDFSKPRTLLCYSSDGQYSKTYTVDIRVHNETKDKFYWELCKTNSQIAQLEDLRAITFQKSIVVYGTVNDESKAYIANINDGNSWTEYSLPSKSISSLVANNTNVYALANGMVYSTAASKTASSFEAVSSDTNLKTLIGASLSEVYAISNDKKLMTSTDGGATWVMDGTTDDLSGLPTRDINGFSCAVKSNADIEKFMLIGNRGLAADKYCVVWSKTIDNSNPSRTQSWTYQELDQSSFRAAPSLTHLSATPYNDGIAMIGGKGLGACTAKAFSQIYFSRDNGQNWWVDTRLSLPSSFKSSDTSFALVSDSANYLWLICGSTGQVWRGHLAQLTWE